VNIKACSHITGGGFYENIPRMLPEGVQAVIRKSSYQLPPIFGMLSKDGDIAEEVMYNTYNMGIGMVIAVDAKEVDQAIKAIQAAGEKAYVIGEVVKGTKGVSLC
ncbi:MAG: phosphoribosylformylglycinamidine cyclo-ligase, partial [Clostridiales bacterium]|nr:phosphoribosylformylglycinamidine cyclo-ligase [Clostridiales bacterium]